MVRKHALTKCLAPPPMYSEPLGIAQMGPCVKMAFSVQKVVFIGKISRYEELTYVTMTSNLIARFI